MTLREVYEKWKDSYWASRIDGWDTGPRPSVDTMAQDCWSAIRAAVEGRCVWSLVPWTGGPFMGYEFITNCAKKTIMSLEHPGDDDLKCCPRCGKPIELESGDGLEIEHKEPADA